jgi:hypothetical protein
VCSDFRNQTTKTLHDRQTQTSLIMTVKQPLSETASNSSTNESLPISNHYTDLINHPTPQILQKSIFKTQFQKTVTYHSIPQHRIKQSNVNQ